MIRPNAEIAFLTDQCKPDRSFPPMIDKGHALAMLRYIEWLEKWFDTERFVKENVKFSSDLESL